MKKGLTMRPLVYLVIFANPKLGVFDPVFGSFDEDDERFENVIVVGFLFDQVLK